MLDLLRELFAANRVIILSVYGQVFFLLGVVLALQSWRHSRVVLARHLKWLAAFGLLHGLHEWGDVFIPLQGQYLAEPFIEVLLVLQVLLLAVSFACLFQFGLECLRPFPDGQWWVRYLAGAGLVVWIFIAFGPTSTLLDTGLEWSRLNNILARYSLGFPGALVAAYGLRRQTQKLVAPVEMPHIWQTLRVAGLALAGYSVLSGLVVSPADFFPANWLNSAILEQITLVPVQVYRSILGLILLVAIIRALEVFQIELDRRLSNLEESQVLMAERERIGRELHDGTLQAIYAAGLLLRTSEKELIAQVGPPQSLTRLQQSIALLDEAVSDIRGYIGTLRAQPTGHSLAAGLRDLATAGHLRSLVEVELDLKLPDEQPLTPGQVGHLLAIVNEALSNVIRHAQATQVQLKAELVEDRFHLVITDNGRGLVTDYVVGYGLRNMRERARLLGGEATIESNAGRGITVRVEVPWEDG
jgi:signal transduction histidine kinase